MNGVNRARIILVIVMGIIYT